MSSVERLSPLRRLKRKRTTYCYGKKVQHGILCCPFSEGPYIGGSTEDPCKTDLRPYVRPYLALWDGDDVPVSHGMDRDAQALLPVPLLEVLLHDPVRPVGGDLRRLHGVAEVGAMDQTLQHLRRRRQKDIFIDMLR